MKRYRTAAAFVIVVLVATFSAWRSQSSADAVVREKEARIHAQCLQLQRHHDEFVAIGKYLISRTPADPRSQAAVHDFADFLDNLNGKRPVC